MIRLYCFSICFCTTVASLYSQSTEIGRILEEIEKEYNVAFNYNPENLSQLNEVHWERREPLNEVLKKLLANTPLNYKILEKSIVLFNAEKKTKELCATIANKEGDPLVGANVFLLNKSKGAQTDLNGEINLMIDALPFRQVVVSYISYESDTIFVSDLWKTEEGCPLIRLNEKWSLLDESIVIKDYIIPAIQSNENGQLLHWKWSSSRNDIWPLSLDLHRSLQFLPGISSTDDSATNLNIRGFLGSQNDIIWEGITLYGAQHFYGMVSGINPYVVDNIEIQRGLQSIEYGNRIGGLVNINLPDIDVSKNSFGIGSNLTEQHGYVNFTDPEEKFHALIALRKSIPGLLRSPTTKKYSDQVFQGSQLSENIELETEEGGEFENKADFYDINAKFQFKVNERTQFSTSFLRTDNNFNIASEVDDIAEEGELLKEKTNALKIRLDHSMSNFLSLYADYSISNYHNDYEEIFFDENQNVTLNAESSFNEVDEQSVRIGLTKASNENEFSVGYQLQQFNLDWELIQNNEFSADLNGIFEFSNNFHSLYGHYILKKSKLNVDGGLRMSVRETDRRFFWSPRIFSNYRLSDAFNFKFHLGRQYQFVSQLQQFDSAEINPNNQIWIMTNEEFDNVTSSSKVMVGGNFQYKSWLLELETYYQRISGLASFSNKINSENIEFDQFGSADAYGFDLLINRSFGKMNVWINYSLGFNQLFFKDISEETFPANHHQFHILTLNGIYRYNYFQFSTQLNYKSGLPFSENPLVEIEDMEEDEDQFSFEYDEINEGRLPTYFSLDLSLSYKPKFKVWGGRMEASMSIRNLFNRLNIFERTYDLRDINGVNPIVIQTDRFLLRRTPQLSIRFFW